MKLPPSVNRQQFEKVTGYRIVPDDQQGPSQVGKGTSSSGDVGSGGVGSGRVRSPGASDGMVTIEAPGGGGTVELPLAELERMMTSYQALRGPEGRADQNAAEVSRHAGQSLVSLRADLNKSLFDGSPLVVTEAEARHAHATLMRCSPEELSQVLGSLDDKMLNRYLDRIGQAEPFSLEEPGPSPLGELALKLALELDPKVGQELMGRLGEGGRQALLKGAMELPSGAAMESLRGALGQEGFRQLVQGPREDVLIGRGLLAGKAWKENATTEFKGLYSQAANNDLPLPKGAEDTIFLTGPGLFGDQLPGYLEPNKRALVEWGVPPENVQKLDYNTASKPQENADAIYEQIKTAHESGKKIVVMGHSKFGRDMLEAFHRHPDLKDMVSGSLLMQPAISAQIAADLSIPQLAAVLDPVLQLVGGNRGAFDGLSEKMEDLPPWPGGEVPTVVMASSSESPAAFMRAGQGPYYEKLHKTPSDGAVSLQNQASIDDATLVSLPGLADHAQPGLTFVDLCEHFAVQVEAGAPDDVVRGMLDRLKAMLPKRAPIDALEAMFAKAHDTPEERMRCAAQLRATGPMLDRLAQVLNRNAGHPLVDNEAMTKALVSQLFDRM